MTRAKTSSSRRPNAPTFTSANLLGDFHYTPSSFPDLQQTLRHLETPAVRQLPPNRRCEAVHEALRSLIEASNPESFLLSCAMEFIAAVNRIGFLDEPYRLQTFEFWLNHSEAVTDEDNYRIRGQLAGRYVPRDEYQVFFPIGMNKRYAGSHFVAAHLSPDVDTAVASFWGWVDAFSARVSEGQHHWSLPTGGPDLHIQRILTQLIGEGVFEGSSHPSTTLNLAALDLLTLSHVRRERGHTLSTLLDHTDQQAIIHVDEEGYYLGDWRRSDVEPVRQILMTFKACLRWFENSLHCKLISFFAKPDLTAKDLPDFIFSVFSVPVEQCEPVKEFTEKQHKNLQHFCQKILGIPQGLSGTFGELDRALSCLVHMPKTTIQQQMQSLAHQGFFDEQERLKEDRSTLFPLLESVIKDIDEAILAIHKYTDRLEVAMRVKQEVLGKSPLYVTVHSDVEELRIKMKEQDSLTVVEVHRDGKLWPVGIVSARTLRKSVLGTVTQRDFCNRSESKMASYLEVISVVDHHKSSLDTTAAPMVIVGDAQSSNVLVAELSFRINDSYSLGGQTPETVQQQLSQQPREVYSSKEMRRLQRLLQRKMAADNRGLFYVHPAREYAEYLSYLYAIMDDTDLLTKVSARDVVCVASLLNRLKSLTIGQETEIITLDDIPRDEQFANTAAQRILQNEDMYSLYRKVYEFKEEEVEKALTACTAGKSSNIFADTKEQNGCCRVGQTKIFSSNFSQFTEHALPLRRTWLKIAQELHQEQRELDLHMHMISTVASAQEVYKGTAGRYTHQDELWIWAAPTQTGYDHLASFLSAFQEQPQMQENTVTLAISGPSAHRLEQTFQRNFLPCEIIDCAPEDEQEALSIAIVRFNAGTLNSRKSMITPYLPHLVV